jgi:hypothetical protein
MQGFELLLSCYKHNTTNLLTINFFLFLLAVHNTHNNNKTASERKSRENFPFIFLSSWDESRILNVCLLPNDLRLILAAALAFCLGKTFLDFNFFFPSFLARKLFYSLSSAAAVLFQFIYRWLLSDI